ncbi:MAG: hypothetical protein HZA11_03320 [Nitrospirae bacterium]|nr:hypothetical protein [Nitrospirota bacterium]
MPALVLDRHDWFSLATMFFDPESIRDYRICLRRTDAAQSSPAYPIWITHA